MLLYRGLDVYANISPDKEQNVYFIYFVFFLCS